MYLDPIWARLLGRSQLSILQICLFIPFSVDSRDLSIHAVQYHISKRCHLRHLHTRSCRNDHICYTPYFFRKRDECSVSFKGINASYKWHHRESQIIVIQISFILKNNKQINVAIFSISQLITSAAVGTLKWKQYAIYTRLAPCCVWL